jgi:hypothetical protein
MPSGHEKQRGGNASLKVLVRRLAIRLGAPAAPPAFRNKP